MFPSKKKKYPLKKLMIPIKKIIFFGEDFLFSGEKNPGKERLIMGKFFIKSGE